MQEVRCFRKLNNSEAQIKQTMWNAMSSIGKPPKIENNRFGIKRNKLNGNFKNEMICLNFSDDANLWLKI